MHRMSDMHDIGGNRRKIVDQVPLHFGMKIIFEVEEAVAFPEGDAMDRQAIVNGIEGSDSLELILARSRTLVAYYQNLGSVFDRLARQAPRVDLCPGRPVRK